MKSTIFLALNVFLLLSYGASFSISNCRGTSYVASSLIDRKYVSITSRSRPVLYSSPSNEEKADGAIESPAAVANTSASSSGTNVEEKPYPIDLPSPILLATSMVLAIVGTGTKFRHIFFVESYSSPQRCYLPQHFLVYRKNFFFHPSIGSAFDLGGGSPSLGFGPTAAIAAITIPLCLFLFYASILKATAETEADDKEFMKGKY